MNKCHITGCRRLETKCVDCNRIVSTTVSLDKRWVSVEDELPEFGERVLGVDMQDPFIDILVYMGFGSYKGDSEWSSYSCNTFIPTHWMPLPNPPQELFPIN